MRLDYQILLKPPPPKFTGWIHPWIERQTKHWTILSYLLPLTLVMKKERSCQRSLHHRQGRRQRGASGARPPVAVVLTNLAPFVVFGPSPLRNSGYGPDHKHPTDRDNFFMLLCSGFNELTYFPFLVSNFGILLFYTSYWWNWPASCHVFEKWPVGQK